MGKSLVRHGLASGDYRVSHLFSRRSFRVAFCRIGHSPATAATGSIEGSRSTEGKGRTESSRSRSTEGKGRTEGSRSRSRSRSTEAKDALKVAEARCDENSARTGEPFYSAEQQARFDSYTTGVTDSGQLQELIRYAHTLFDIKELQEKLDRDGYVIFRPEAPEDIMAKAVAFTKGFLTDDPANFKGTG